MDHCESNACSIEFFFMSTLRSALDELQAEDLCFAGNDELEADFAEQLPTSC